MCDGVYCQAQASQTNRSFISGSLQTFGGPYVNREYIDHLNGNEVQINNEEKCVF